MPTRLEFSSLLLCLCPSRRHGRIIVFTLPSCRLYSVTALITPINHSLSLRPSLPDPCVLLSSEKMTRHLIIQYRWIGNVWLVWFFRNRVAKAQVGWDSGGVYPAVISWRASTTSTPVAVPARNPFGFGCVNADSDLWKDFLVFCFMGSVLKCCKRFWFKGFPSYSRNVNRTNVVGAVNVLREVKTWLRDASKTLEGHTL